MLESEYDKSRRRLPRHLARAPEPERPFQFDIRDREPADIPHVREIYNSYVTNSVVTLDDKPWSLRRWQELDARLHKAGLPFLVAQSPSGQILGYALVQPWTSRAPANYTVESSIYLGQASTGKGLGAALLHALIDACRAAGVRELVAVISDSQAQASVALHERAGFVEAGRMGRVGYKFDRWLGTITMRLALAPEQSRWWRRSAPARIDRGD